MSTSNTLDRSFSCSPASTSNNNKMTLKNSSKFQFFLQFPCFFFQSKKPTKEIQYLAPLDTSDRQSLAAKAEETEEMHREKEKDEKEIEGGMQKAVKQLLFGNWEERERAAVDVLKLASQDVKMKKTLAELGVIPPLVDMVASNVVTRRRSAVEALLCLGDGTFTNKALILEAGILSKLPKDIDEVDEPTRNEIAKLLSSLSSLSNSQFPLNPSKLLPFLLAILQSNSTSDKSKEACLGTLYNLSAVIENSGPLISSQVVDVILGIIASSSAEKVLEKALATLANLVVTMMGKKALEDNALVPESLIDVLILEEKPKCIEISAYILMILAHQSSKQREKMEKLGIVHVLLEVALLGTPLAQKRALKLLQWFKDERETRVGPHSGPVTRRMMSMGSPVSERETSEGKRLMRKMVKQSLYKNLEVITKRANAAGESSKLKSLVISSSSKSLPY